MITDLNKRARDVFGEIVDSYLNKEDPLGSRTLSKRLEDKVSAATIRNVMADLQEMGLIYSPHKSAGRLPTDLGLRFYVDSYMGESKLSADEKQKIEAQCLKDGMPINDVYAQTSRALSGLSSCAGMVLVPTFEAPLQHIEFVELEPGKALAVLVFEDQRVENRLIDVPKELPVGGLQQASNYLKHVMNGRTLSDVRTRVEAMMAEGQQELDALTQKVVKAGVAIQPEQKGDLLIVQGASNIIDANAMDDVKEIQNLFDLLERQETATRLLKETVSGDGVQIFIGAENRVFQTQNLSMVVSAYRDENRRVVGATGVIGPTRLNYRRVVPMVDYTAKLMSQMVSRKLS